ncbi:hypothetical protein [Marinifilum sp. D714]|uniref:hypothetical protein n=1 Tax=Marinifilum sp. D714 TaxID=2937523 RepID=UPI0027CC20DB|nr:hypothetical protein [Marinifilum sp. D714]MDQ2178571.1 hypothetical protein [Marinifilum sp. D714]
MKHLLIKILFLLFLFFLGFVISADAQSIAIKKWKGRYPRMNNDYPAAFICFKGWLPPVPHLFIKTPGTHYYWKVKSGLVTDSKEISGKLKTGALRLLAKTLEKSQFEGRYKETNQTKGMNEMQNSISNLIYNAQKDELADLYNTAASLYTLYHELDNFKALKEGNRIRKILKKEADQLLSRFLMINLLETDHGEKFRAFSELQKSLTHLKGEVDYTYNKLFYFQSFGDATNRNLAFLSQ